ncbi:MAG TPA: AraC family transcriptional regulator [Burkholderiaceae bacterium]|nr:AraC family transcriptional regulator [Burkholderiaceae bacterium]
MRPPTIVDPALLRQYGAETGRHSHDHAQVLFGLEGNLDMEVEGHAAYVDGTCGLVVPAGATHSYQAERGARVFVLDCDPDAGTDRLRRFALPPGWRSRLISREVLLAALGEAPTLAPRRRIDLDALSACIDADLARAWTVADLARLCHLSPQRLRARFAEAYGISPLEFVRSRRLDRAERLLRQGWTLEAVALQVGYACASALSAAIRRERNTGARELRRTPQALRES